ncbi:uncharacterized protein LOC135385135 [Ornithodoros turicata]|uniref:uncharacterized protein LOC135385135 n=1 Tax=Ornithodoros turicata TaxID=34597 RepID=UPI0031392678
MTPAVWLLCLMALITTSTSAIIPRETANSKARQVEHEQLIQLLLPIYVKLPPGIHSASGSSRDSIRQQEATAGAESLRRQSVVIPGAIIVDPRSGVLLPKGRSREELEPAMRDSLHIMQRFLQRSRRQHLDSPAPRRRRSVSQGQQDVRRTNVRRPHSWTSRHRTQPSRSVKSPREGHVHSGRLRRRRIPTPSTTSDYEVVLSQKDDAAHNSSLSKDDVSSLSSTMFSTEPRHPITEHRETPRVPQQKKSQDDAVVANLDGKDGVIERLKTRHSAALDDQRRNITLLLQDARRFTPKASTTAQTSSSTTQTPMHPELRKFLVAGMTDNSSSDLLVIKDVFNETSIRPYEALRVNTTGASPDRYGGTPVKNLGKFWMLPPGFKNRRRRRSVLPYYAVSSFALSPTYPEDKNQTFYTVFARVSDSMLRDFMSKNGRAPPLEDPDDDGHIYSEELFNYVTSRADRNHENVIKDLRGRTWEELFHKVYEQMKEDEEKRHGTMEPLGYHFTYALHHGERGMRSSENRSGEGKGHEAGSKVSMRKREDTLEHREGESSTASHEKATTQHIDTHSPWIHFQSNAEEARTEHSPLPATEALLEYAQKQQQKNVPEDITKDIIPEITQKLAELGYEVKAKKLVSDKTAALQVGPGFLAEPNSQFLQVAAKTRLAKKDD